MSSFLDRTERGFAENDGLMHEQKQQKQQEFAGRSLSQDPFLFENNAAFLQLSRLEVQDSSGSFHATQDQVKRFTFRSTSFSSTNVENNDEKDVDGPWWMELLLENADDNSQVLDKSVRWCLMGPQSDWRVDHHSNETTKPYVWKLSSSWISARSSAIDQWYYWNLNNEVDSQLMLPSWSSEGARYRGMVCEYMEFHYRKKKSKRKQAVLKMYNVQMGFETDQEDALLYHPCLDLPCHAVDGTVFCGDPTRVWIVRNAIWLHVLLIVPLVLCCGFLVLRRRSRQGRPLVPRRRRYAQVHTEELEQDNDNDKEEVKQVTFPVVLRDHDDEDSDDDNDGGGEIEMRQK